MIKSLKVYLGATIIFGIFIFSNINVFAEDTISEETTNEVIPQPPTGSPSGDENIRESEEVEEDKVPTEIQNQENTKKEITKRPIDTPASVTGEKYSGSGTVIDFTSTGSKAFYTIQAIDNSLYYLIIDLDKTENNVYFLSEINGEELTLGQVTTNTPNETPAPTPQPKKDSKEGSSDAVFYIFLGIAAIGTVAYAYFFKIKKGGLKKGSKKDNLDDTSDDSIDILDDDHDDYDDIYGDDDYYEDDEDYELVE